MTANIDSQMKRVRDKTYHLDDVCGKPFKIKRNWIQRYLKTQTREKPHKCDVCDKSFVHLGSLTVHQHKHTGEKPYQCDVCEMSYADSSSLTVHKRTHTGEKPYQCDICDKSFSHLGSLRGHQQTHTYTRYKPYNVHV